MPFTKHIIEPIMVSQCPLPAGEPNELECLSNLTLANVIRQLSSLGQHAGRIFDELSKDAVQLNTRTIQMNQRLEKLQTKISQLDIQSEEVTLADFQTKKQFKSSTKFDQKVVSRDTMPEAMRIMYNNADPPPALDKLNPFRKDGKDCMKFYTDPGFFFDIWYNELMKDNETRLEKGKIDKKRRKTKTVGGEKNPNNPNISHPIPHNQQLTKEEALIYQQQQIAKANGHNQHHYHQQQKQGFVSNDFDDQSLPPPPMPHMINVPGLNNYEIYSEASHGPNGSATRIQIQQGTLLQQQQQQRMNQMQHNNINNNKEKIYSSERPALPPPPVPVQNHLSDLQQIQQQMTRKKNSDFNNTNNHTNNNNENGHGVHENDGHTNGNTNDLPPPPSPPHMDNHLINGNNFNNSYNHQQGGINQNFMKMNLNGDNNKDEAFDMPLPPPPPMDLTDSYIGNLPPPLPESNIPQNGNNLPPPPPLPPLVESDTVSTASSASITNNMPSHNQHNSKSADTSKNDEVKTTVTKNSYLDDINQRRFQLKSSKRDATGSNGNNSILSEGKENGETIQPFVNNSDVAAIIDFIRKFRPHVRDSSEEDEENSDWDE